MTMANGQANRRAQFGDSVGPGPSTDPTRVGVVVMAGTLVLDTTYRNTLKLDPAGAVRDVRLPPPQAGLWFRFIHGGAANFTITVRNDTGLAVVGTLPQNTEIEVWCSDDAAPAWVFLCKRTIALT